MARRRRGPVATLWRYFSPAILPVLFAGLAYGAWPAFDAYRLERAITVSDIGAVRIQVDWVGVRESLRASILARLSEAKRQRPLQASFATLIRYNLADRWAPGIIDKRLAEDVTPEGFVRYMSAAPPPGKPVPVRVGRYVTVMLPGPPSATASRPTFERIRKAGFQSLTRFAIDIEDRFDPGKVYRAVLSLEDFAWKLAEVQMLSLGSEFPR